MWIGLLLEGASNVITRLPLMITAPIAIIGVIALSPLSKNASGLMFLIICAVLVGAGFKAIIYLGKKFPTGIINDLLAVGIVVLFLASLILLMLFGCLLTAH